MGRVVTQVTVGETGNDDDGDEAGRGAWARRDRGADLAHRPVVVSDADHVRGPDGVGHLCRGPRLYAQVVFRRAVPLSDAVLLAVYHQPVRRGCGRVRYATAGLVDH